MLIVSKNGCRVGNTETMQELYIEKYDKEEYHICMDGLSGWISKHTSEAEAKRMLRKITDAYAANERVFSLQEENKWEER